MRKGRIQLGDIITRLDGEAVDDSDDLTRILERKQVGDTVQIEVWRNGQRVHRSAIVQIGKIREAELTFSDSYKLLLENGVQIVMSRCYHRRLPKSVVG